MLSIISSKKMDPGDGSLGSPGASNGSGGAAGPGDSVHGVFTAGDVPQFKNELLSHVEAGHRGLETAFRLLCVRLIDLEGVWDKAREDQEAKYRELQQLCLDQQEHLSGLNDIRKGLSDLESRVEKLALAQALDVGAGADSTPPSAAPSNDAVLPDKAEDAARGDVGIENTAAMREELRALKRKVGIIAANVMGEAEGEVMEITARAAPEKELRGYSSNISYDDTVWPDDRTAGNTAIVASVDEKSHQKSPQVDHKGAATAERGSRQQTAESASSNDVGVLRGKAKARWVKIRMNRTFLVKKIRRQVMAERKVGESETVVTRVERLEKALGVNVYTTGSGRLDILAREVRLSLNAIVEYQARAASDNLSTPLFLFPASAGDLSLISTGTLNDTTHPKNNRDPERRYSQEWSQLLPSKGGANAGAGAGEDAGGNGCGWINRADGSSAEFSQGVGGDVGRLWMAEDGGYLCLDLLLERTLQEMAEGLAFVASQLEQRRPRSATSGSNPPIDHPSAPYAAPGTEDAAALARKVLPPFVHEDDGGESAPKLTREITRMRDRCARLGVLIAQVAAAQQRKHGGGGQDREELRTRLPTEHGGGKQDPSSGTFAAAEQLEEQGAVTAEQQATAVTTSEVLRLSCALAGDIQYLLSRPAYCRVLEAFSFTPGRKCLCARDFDAAAAATATPALAPTINPGGKQGDAGGWRPSFTGGDGGAETVDRTHGFRVRPTVYQCVVFSLGHLSRFLSTARSRSAHRAVSSLRAELGRDVLAAKLVAREAVAAAAAAQNVARLASSEALEATTRAASAAASARTEGSLLLEELHEQLAMAMRTERDRLEQENRERARADTAKSQLLETQLAYLKSLLDSKAGQEDLTSITRAMGDAEETLAVVRQAIPGQSVLLELQEALSRKADKAYTKRQMTLLVSRVSALLKEQFDQPSMAKKCLSCDRAFHTLSFKDIELAKQLPGVLESNPDVHLRAQQHQQHRMIREGNGLGDDRVEGGGGGSGWLRGTTLGGSNGPGSPGDHGEARGERPGSAPITGPRPVELRPLGNHRPSSAAPHRLGGKATSGSRPGSAQRHTSFFPPAGSKAGSSSTSHLVSPAALSATYGALSNCARKAAIAEAARAERVSSREPSPAPDHLRYGGMTQAPLVRQLFAGLGYAGRNTSASSTGATGTPSCGVVGNGTTAGEGTRGVAMGPIEGKGRGRPGKSRSGVGVDVGREVGGVCGKIIGVGGALANDDRRPLLGGGGTSTRENNFASTLEHHRQNVLAVTVPPVRAICAGGFVPETLIRPPGDGGGGKERSSKPHHA